MRLSSRALGIALLLVGALFSSHLAGAEPILGFDSIEVRSRSLDTSGGWRKSMDVSRAKPIDFVLSGPPTEMFDSVAQGEPFSVPPQEGTLGSAISKQAVFHPRGASSSAVSYTRAEIANPNSFPYWLHGKLLIEFPLALAECSGSIVNSPNKSLVITAAHCLYEPELGGWPSQVFFAPGYRNGVAPSGWLTAELAFVTDEWFETSQVGSADQRYDIGALSIVPFSDGQHIAQAFGSRGILFNQNPRQNFVSYGYPAASPFDGEKLWYCSSAVGYDDPAYPVPKPIAMGCDMTQGSSGGGWVIQNQYVNSVVSYAYTFEPEIHYGPYFGTVAQSLWSEAGNYGGPAPTPSPSVSPSPSPSPSPSVSPSPSPSPTVSPTPISYHQQQISLWLRRHLRAKGRVFTSTAYSPCYRGVPVAIFKKRSSGGWRLLRQGSTDFEGRFKIRLPDRKGRYYAATLTEDIIDDANVCLGAASQTRRHRH